MGPPCESRHIFSLSRGLPLGVYPFGGLFGVTVSKMALRARIGLTQGKHTYHSVNDGGRLPYPSRVAAKASDSIWPFSVRHVGPRGSPKLQ